VEVVVIHRHQFYSEVPLGLYHKVALSRRHLFAPRQKLILIRKKV